MPDTAIVYIYFQAADRLTWIAHDVLGASSTATGQETVPALGRVPEIPFVELALPRIPLHLKQAESGNAIPPRA